MSREPKSAPVMRARTPRTPSERAASVSNLPRSPEVDEAALGRAEQEIGATRSRGAGFPTPPAVDEPDEAKEGLADAASAPRAGRKRRDRVPQATVYIKGPKPIADAFKQYMDDNDFRNGWGALEDLLLKAGVEIEPFDT